MDGAPCFPVEDNTTRVPRTRDALRSDRVLNYHVWSKAYQPARKKGSRGMIHSGRSGWLGLRHFEFPELPELAPAIVILVSGHRSARVNRDNPQRGVAVVYAAGR